MLKPVKVERLKNVKRIGEFIPVGAGLPFPLVSIDDLLNREIIIRSVDFFNGNYGEYVVIGFTYSDDDELRAFRTGGKVIVKKMKQLKEVNGIPCLARVIKGGTGRNRYYDLI